MAHLQQNNNTMRDVEVTVVTMEGIAADMAAFLLKRSAGR